MTIDEIKSMSDSDLVKNVAEQVMGWRKSADGDYWCDPLGSIFRTDECKEAFRDAAAEIPPVPC